MLDLKSNAHGESKVVTMEQNVLVLVAVLPKVGTPPVPERLHLKMIAMGNVLHYSMNWCVCVCVCVCVKQDVNPYSV